MNDVYQTKLNQIQTAKLEEAVDLIIVTFENVLESYDKITESALVKVLRNIPRTHLLVIKSLHRCMTEEVHPKGL